MSEESAAAGVAERLAEVREAIGSAARQTGRAPEAVTLVAVSKTVSGEAVEEAIKAGQRVFGENRVQEANGKWPALKERHPDLELHLIGPLQTNKVADAVRLFDCIESVDRDKLARALATEMEKQGRQIPVLVQVNTGHEPQKAGILPETADAFLADARSLGLDIRGLMCIPPAEGNPAPHFALLSQIAARNGLQVLSMGMSGDFEAAVAKGATHVRVGTAIFGSRS